MVKEFRDEAYDARRTRIELNRRNFDALHGRMDWSHKIEGQTTEFLPKTGVALEQFAAMVEESITGAKDWYLPVMGRSRRFPLSDVQARSLLTALLDNTALNASESGPIQRVIVDGIKLGALGSLAIFKVHVALQYKHDDGGYGQEQSEMPSRNPSPEINSGGISGEFGPSDFFEGGQAGPNVTRETIRPEGLPGRPTFRLRVETIRQEDFYPDPTGRGLYEIHRSERDFYTVDWMAREGVYDMEAVQGLKSWYEQERQQRANAEKGQNQTNSPSTRRIVTIDEYWGDILDDDGRCVMKNCFFAIANEQFIIRKPAPNPFWHNRSPFVRVPILRVPNSVWHRALFDGPVEMNLTMNEIYSLMVDGAIGSVWGTRQLRIDDLENPEEVSAGVPQGKTLQVKSSLPPGVKVMEDLTNGKIPPEALAMFELVNREFSSGAMSNELRLGSMPERSVKATEIVASEQSVGNLTRAIAKHIELGIGEILHLCWMNAMQHLEMIEPDLIIDAVGPQTALLLLRMPPEARQAIFSQPVAFRVSGLSAMIGRTKDFQKMMALIQAIGANPILLLSFFKKYNPEAVLAHLIKSLNIDPDQLARDDESLNQLPLELAQMQAFQQVVQPKAGQNPGQSPTTTGESSLPAEINQMTNPLTGIPAAR